MSATPEHVESKPQSEAQPPRARSRVGTWGNVAVGLWLAFVAIGQIFLWFIMDMKFGRSIPVMVTYSMGIVTVFVLLAWVAFFSPIRRTTALVLAGLLLIPIVGFAASIRNVHFTGDIEPVLTFRWEPTQEERLRAFREQSAPEQPVTAVEVPEATPEDMPEFRGVNRDGVVIGPPLSEDWSARPPRELWRHPCGGGYASFAILGDFLVTIEQRGPNEAVVCYDANTGLERWTHEYPASFFEGMGGPGPRATPTIDGTDVFSLGAIGDLYCLDLATGEPRWNVNILTGNGLTTLNEQGETIPFNAIWAMASSPLLLDGKVIVNAGGPVGNGLVAYDRTSGETVWRAAGLEAPAITPTSLNRAGYSSPQLVTLAGVPQILIFDGVGLRGCSPETGEQLWFHQYDEGEGPGTINVAQPLMLPDDRVFISASYGRGSAVLRIMQTDGAWQVEPEGDFEKMTMRCKFSSPVLHEGAIYGLDEGLLMCIDAQSGKRLWKKDRGAQYGHGQILLTNDRLFLLSEAGELVLVDAAPDAWDEIGKFPALEGEKTWNPPVLSRGRAYVRNHLEMAAFDLTGD
jgi:outer membrane protein assembly factor BamB